MSEKPDRPRMNLDAPDEIRLAVHLAATKKGISHSELVCDILRKALADVIADARKYVPPREPGPQRAPKGRRRQEPEAPK